MLQYAQQKAVVCLVATCRAIEQTHKFVQSGNLFPNVLALQVPSKAERIHMLERLMQISSELQGYTLSDDVIQYMAARTENYAPADLQVSIFLL